MSHKTILVIEDDSNIRDVLKLSLEFEGYKVMTAENGKQGFEVLNQGQLPGLILLDLMMPVMNGWEFLDEFNKHEKYNEIPVIVVSAYGDKMKELACADFVVKPLELDNLINKVNKNFK